MCRLRSVPETTNVLVQRRWQDSTGPRKWIFFLSHSGGVRVNECGQETVSVCTTCNVVSFSTRETPWYSTGRTERGEVPSTCRTCRLARSNDNSLRVLLWQKLKHLHYFFLDQRVENLKQIRNTFMNALQRQRLKPLHDFLFHQRHQEISNLFSATSTISSIIRGPGISTICFAVRSWSRS